MLSIFITLSPSQLLDLHARNLLLERMQSASQQNPVPWGEGVKVVHVAQMKNMKYVQEPDPALYERPTV